MKKNELITTINMDLSISDNLCRLPISDSIFINHFIPNNKVFTSLQDKFKNGGILMIVAFDERMLEIRPIPHNYILDFNSLESNLSDMSLLKKEEFHDERGYFRAAAFTIKVLSDSSHFFLIKRNIRKESRDLWLSRKI